MAAGRGLIAVCLASLMASQALALPFRIPRPLENQKLNSKLQGRVLDFTKNHAADNRFWAPSLCAKRDMYVYVPPCYDESKQYPLLIWLHGFSQDEKAAKMLAGPFDSAVLEGRLPPMVIAIPDGTFRGTPSMTNSGSFYLDGPKGRYEDYLIDDVWNFINSRFSIRPEREAHVLAGASMGGTSAFNLAFKHKDKFGVVVGIMPLLDLLYADCHGNHFGPFDPNCLGRTDRYRPAASAGSLFLVIPIRNGKAMRPVMGNRKEVEERLPRENPVELLDLNDIQPGEFKMFISYGAHDQFNGSAEAQSFLHRAAQRGITAELVVNPNGRHNKKTGMSFFDPWAAWLNPILAPYAP